MKRLTKEDNFNEIIKSEKVLIDFSAEWCGPCKMLAPVLESIDSIDIYKVDTDEFPDLAREYGIMSIPTLIYFKDGEIVNRNIGFVSKEDIEEGIKNM